MNPEDEAYAQQLIERMKAQGMGGNPNMFQNNNQGSPDQSPGGPIIDNKPSPGGPITPQGPGGVDVQSEAILSSVKTGEPPKPAQGAFADCPQCGTMHPPLRPGEICPMKKVEVKEAGITDDDINRFLASMKNIAVSQIQSKGIKNGNKLFQYLTVEVTKLLEAYKEE